MKPYIHATLSAKKYGGDFEDYIKIHDFMDQTKASLADMRHRAILHNSHGIYIVEQVFGDVMTNKDGVTFSVRDVCEDHCVEDLGKIPTIEQCLAPLNEENSGWLWGRPRSVRTIKLVD